MKGLFITFEGIEGCGKSTHAERLADSLRKEGYSIITARDPGSTAIGEALRDLVKTARPKKKKKAGGLPDIISGETEALIFAASRAELVNSVVRPALTRGKVVVCDRFVDSSIAYQGYGRRLGVRRIVEINRMATGGLVPGLTFLLDLDVDTGLRRAGKRNGRRKTSDRFESESAGFYDRVRKGYLDLSRRWPGRFSVVDASRDFREVAAEIRETALARLRVRSALA